jgi:triphosphoribosyl-dephospho-CoA synthase
MTLTATDRARAAFLSACRLDVAVRKPGNVSIASPGHGMQAAMFVASADAAAPLLFAPGERVGRRIEAAMAATWAAAGCNTNLGILLLCAPIAAAVEHVAQGAVHGSMRQTVEEVLADLDLHDAEAAFRAIALARPGGLGEVPEQDVRHAPSIGLRSAMALAAARDRIAWQYAHGFADLFDVALPLLPLGFSLMAGDTDMLADAATTAAVQRLYLGLLSELPDSHIVRKHGEAVAHTVMRSAQAWKNEAQAGAALDTLPAFAAWDASLKDSGINPGTTADLTVAALLLASVLEDAKAQR